MARARPSERAWGYTLVELMVIVAVIGILAAIAVPSFLFVLRRERVNALAFEIAGWLEETRSFAAREVNPDPLAGGCAIVIAAPQADAQAGAVIAGISGCAARELQLRVQDTWGGALPDQPQHPGGHHQQRPNGGRLQRQRHPLRPLFGQRAPVLHPTGDVVVRFGGQPARRPGDSHRPGRWIVAPALRAPLQHSGLDRHRLSQRGRRAGRL